MYSVPKGIVYLLWVWWNGEGVSLSMNDRRHMFRIFEDRGKTHLVFLLCVCLSVCPSLSSVCVLS